MCLTYAEIQHLKKKCIKYRAQARAACGNSDISIRQIFEAREAKKRQFYQRACQRTRENLEKWALEQHDLALLAAEQKRRRLAELTSQLQDAKQRKIDERRANVELELRLLRETEKLEEQRLLRENINLRKRIEYYQELSDTMRSAAGGNMYANQPTAATESQAVLAQSSKSHAQSEGSGESSATAPQTPGSGGTDTDFESCCGEVGKDADADADADSASLYAECLSEEFVQKFAETENALHAICVAPSTECVGDTDAVKTLVTLAAPQEINSETSLHTALDYSVSQTTTLLANPSQSTFLKRSASDVINSNELATAGVAQNPSSTTVTIAPAGRTVPLTSNISSTTITIAPAPVATEKRRLY